jgi:hypothetical protein
MSDTATPAPAPPADGRVPIVIGVTGHRNIASDDPALRAVVEKQFSQLAKDYPGTPFLVLSGLAEGFDRLAAHVALEALPECRLIAVLPMPRADYEADFEAEASRAEFAALMDRAEGRIEIAPPVGDDWKTPGEARNALYAKGGAATAEHAQILIALWDGQPPRGEGGTARVVEWFKRGLAPKRYSFHEGELSPLDPPEPGLLIHVTPDGEVSRQITETKDGTPSAIKAILERTRCFNRDIRRNEKRMGHNWPLVSDIAGVNADRMRAGAPGFVAVYNAADTLAVRFRDMVGVYDRLFHVLLLLTFVIYALRDLIPLAVIFYLAAALFTVAVWWLLERRSVADRFLENRAVAEAMRVAFFWRLAGVRRPAWLSYLSKHSGAITWVRHALRSLEFRHEALSSAFPVINAEVGLKAARECWIEDQMRFYASAKARHADSTRRWTKRSKWLLRSSLALVLLLALATPFYGDWSSWSWREGASIFGIPVPQLSEYLQVLIGALAAGGVVARAYLTRRAHEDLTKQYNAALLMFQIAAQEFDQAEERLGKGETPDWPREEVLRQLGDEALVEHGEWVVLRHSRPYEMPQG